MKREDLSKLGITDEAVINEIMKLHGLDIEGHKAKLSDAETTVANLTNQLTEANTAIAGFKNLDIEGMKKSVGEWETKYATLQQESADKLAKTHFDYDITTALTAAKVRDVKAARALLDEKVLKHDAEKHSFDGLDAQLNSLKEQKGWLFDGQQEETMTIVKGGESKKSVTGDAMTNAATDALNRTLGIQTK